MCLHTRTHKHVAPVAMVLAKMPLPDVKMPCREYVLQILNGYTLTSFLVHVCKHLLPRLCHEVHCSKAGENRIRNSFENQVWGLKDPGNISNKCGRQC